MPLTQAKIAFAPPPPHFLTKSLIGLVSFVSLLMIGCDVSQSERDKHYFTVSFYDANLDLNGSVSVKSPINIAQLKIDLGLSATKLYRAGSEDDVINQTSYPITGDTNFYFDLNVTEITDQAGLADINATAATLGGKYILLNDIALDESGAGFEPTYGWKPMGDSYSSFTGIFNGNGHKITGLWIERPSMNFVGLFGRADTGAMIKNIGVEIANGKTVKGNQQVGGIVGSAMYSTITNSYSTGNISGTGNYVGGIAGGATGNITNSYSTGNISGTEGVGGIVGRVANGSITNSYATGNISGTQYVGGIVGYVATGGDITNSYATGNISGTQYVGGVVGSVYYGTVTNNAAINPS
ncbi:MAG: hypothetical protein LBE89_01030, partial [Helicobacteraceae bacterium]|nr:hypothetical protein [Helicobacteraceae bacterium]